MHHHYHPLIDLDQGPLHYFSVLGRALYTTQHLEMNCKAICTYFKFKKHLIEKCSNPLTDPEFISVIIKHYEHFTLGWFGHFSKKINYPNEDISNTITSILKQAKDARDELAHCLAMGIDINLDIELNDRIDEIKVIIKKIAVADLMCSTTLQSINKEPLIVLSTDEYVKKIVEWVTEETFIDKKNLISNKYRIIHDKPDWNHHKPNRNHHKITSPHRKPHWNHDKSRPTYDKSRSPHRKPPDLTTG